MSSPCTSVQPLVSADGFDFTENVEELNEDQQQGGQSLLPVDDGRVRRGCVGQIGVEEVGLKPLQHIFLNILWIRLSAVMLCETYFNVV